MARLAQGQATLALFRCKIFTTQNMGMQHLVQPSCTPHMHLVRSPSGTTRGDRLCAWSTPFATIIVCECAHRTSLCSHDTPRAQVLPTTHRYTRTLSACTHTPTHPRVPHNFFQLSPLGLAPGAVAIGHVCCQRCLSVAPCSHYKSDFVADCATCT
jgi:hypothetical protein